MLVAAAVYVTTTKGAASVLAVRLNSFQDQITEMKEQLKKLTDVAVEQAEMRGRFGRIEDRQLAEGKRLDDLSQQIIAHKN